MEEPLTAALRAALRGEGPNGILVLGPSGSGKTGLVLACLAQLGCRVEYGNALTVRNREYFTDMDPQESGGSILDFLVPVSRNREKPYDDESTQQQQQQQPSVQQRHSTAAKTADTVLVVDNLDTLANDMTHSLDGLLKLILPPQQQQQQQQHARRRLRVCVCIAAGRHKSDKRLLDLYRRCVEIRVRPPLVWDRARGGAAAPPAAAERSLYPLVQELLTRPMALTPATTAAAVTGLSDPDRVTVGLLFHENVHDYHGAHGASDAVLAGVAHDHATADAIGTLPHQAQTWHLWEICYLLRTFRGNHRLFNGAANAAAAAAAAVTSSTVPATPSFTKLLTRCSTEVGTRAFLVDMCFRLGCSWHELFPRLAQLDAEYTALVSRPTPPALLACLRQAGGGARRTNNAAAAAVSIADTATDPASDPAPRKAPKATAVARVEWLHRRLSAQLVVSKQSRYTPVLTLSEVRRMYRCLRAESGSAAASSKKRSAAVAAAAAKTVRKRPRRNNNEKEEEEEEEEEDHGDATAAEDDDDAIILHDGGGLSDDLDDDDDDLDVSEDASECGSVDDF